MIRRSKSSSHTAWLARVLLDAAGLGVAASLVACGGSVVVDPEEDADSGGTGGATSSSSGSDSTGTGSSPPPPECNPTKKPGNTLESVCVPNPGDGCPKAGTSEAGNLVSAVVESDGPCPVDPEYCWCSTNLVKVHCGPDPSELPTQCCYEAETSHDEVCMGRPFLVAGAARVAAIAKGFSPRAWAVEVDLDLCGIDSATRAHLAAAWAKDGLMEHASVAAFARFALLALSVGAPADMVRAAQRAMADEIRHAELCFGLASAFAGEAIAPGALPLDGALDGSTDLASITADVIREGCIGETVAALLALEAREAASDPTVRSVLDRIARDEAEHAALAWRWVAWACEHGGEAVRAAVRDTFARASAPRTDAGEPEPSDAVEADLRRFGRLPEGERREAARRAMIEVVQRCAAALLARVSGAGDAAEAARASSASV